MSKRRTGSKKSANGKAKQPKNMRLQRTLRAGLDRMGLAYARLLQDPCGAPLAYPVWGSQEGSLLVKTEQIINVGVDAANLNGVFAWCPGTATTTAFATMIECKSLASNTNIQTATASGTGYTVTDLQANSPGRVFLTTQTSVYRPIAACVEVMYNGSESSRSGSIGGGCVAGGTWYNTIITADQIAALVPHGERTPVGKTEFLWYPSGSDDIFQDPSDAIASQQVERRNSIIVNWAGLAANTGLRIKLTGIYEYKPKVASGIAMPTPEAGSRNTMREVLGSIASAVAGNPYVRSAAAAAGSQFVRAVSYQLNQRPRITYMRDELR